MERSIELIAKDVAKRYSLNEDALLGRSDKIFYFNTGKELIEVERKSYLSKCISTDLKTIAVFAAIQTLLSC